MREQLQQVLVEALEYLMSLVREGIRPAEAKTRLHRLQKQHPEPKIDLLWEEETYDRSVHYDTLLHLPGEGTVSLSFCPERTLPWPMRGVHRWSESDLLRVNNTVLTVADAIANLDFIWDEIPLVNRLIDVCIIREFIERNSIDISDEDLQRAMDDFRKAHKLYKAEDTYRWMERRGITHEKLERLIADSATVTKLREQIAAGGVGDYFEKHREDFDTSRIARFDVGNQEIAQQIWEKIRSGATDFYEAMQSHFLAEERAQPASFGMFSVVRRGQISPSLQEAIFAAAPGEVIEPVLAAESWAIIRVLSFAPARLDEPARTAIKTILFEQWLAECRQAATIEWYWG